MPHRAKVLVCDDESVARRAAMRALGRRGFDFVECENGAEAVERCRDETFDLVLVDLRMPVLDGRAALEQIVAMPAPPPVIVLTADQSLRSAIDAVKAGAVDYLAKPYEIDDLRLTVARVLEEGRLKRENARLRSELSRLGGGELIAASAAMAKVLDAVERVAPSDVSVLVRGETGTGKELIARRIHEHSPVASGPLVTMNCAAVPVSLFESELFGHRRGAFTGAERDRTGKFQQADGGTLFLDEVGDMPLATQAKLLRVLADGRVEPLGSEVAIAVSVRIVSATHHDLKALCASGRFREDLLFRLRVVELELPPLRARGDDALLLARRFLGASGRGAIEIDPECEEVLASYPWPGNVRELKNAIERAVIFCRDSTVRVEDLPSDVRAGDLASTGGGVSAVVSGPSEPLPVWQLGDDFSTLKKRAVERFERRTIDTALRAHGGNVSRAAKALGMHRQNLQSKIRELGIDAAEYR